MMENDYDLPALHCYSMNPTPSDTVTTTPLKQQQQQQQQQQQVNASNNNTTATTPLKRTRAKRSCDFCRQRKSRCDADTCTPCTNCKAWGYTCEFQTVRKKRGPPSVYVDNLEKRCKKMEQLLMQLTNTTIKDLERNDFCATTAHRRTISDPSVVSDSTSDDDDDNDHENDDDNDTYTSSTKPLNSRQHRQEENAFAGGAASHDPSSSSILNRLEHLDIQDYDSLKYTGQSAGLELLDQEDVFKSKPYIAWPGRQDMVLQKMADDQLLVVRTEKSPTSGKLDTRLDVGISITSAIATPTTPPITQASSSSSPPPPPFTASPTCFSPWSSSTADPNAIPLPSPASPPPTLSRSTNTTTTASSGGSTLVNTVSQPSKALVDRMVKIYFDHLHPLFPVINKIQFLHLYKSNSPSLSRVVLDSILALSFRFAAQHAFFHSTTMAEHHASFYFRKVMKRLQQDSAARSRLCHVQAGLLATLYLDMNNNTNDDHDDDVASMQWHTLGRAIRTAQDLGLHRSCAHWHLLPASEIETRHRVFYACYILDRWIGARAGKPLTILDRDFDTALPSMYEVTDTSTTTTTKQQQPVYRAFVLWVKLSEILGRVLKACYAPNAKKANSNANLDDPMILTVFDRRLKHWQATLEEPVDGTFLSLAQNVSLQIYYNTVILLLRRPFISTSKYVAMEHLVMESRKVSLEVACNIFQLVQQCKSQYPLNKLITDEEDDDDEGLDDLLPSSFGATHLLPTCHVYGMFLSSLVHVAVVLHDRTSLPNQRALADSIALLHAHHHLYASRRALEIIHMLVAIYEIEGVPDKDGLTRIKLEKPALTETPLTAAAGDQRLPFLTNYTSSTNTKDTVVDPFYISPSPSHHTAIDAETKETGMVFQPSFSHYPSSSITSTAATTSSTTMVSSYIETEMPKSQWFQRFVNTSVVGGIPVDIHQDIHTDLSLQRHHHHHHPSYPSPTTTPTATTTANMISSTVNITPLDTANRHTHPHHHHHHNHHHSHDSSLFYAPFIPSTTTTSSTQYPQPLLPSSTDLISEHSRSQYAPPLVLPLPSSTPPQQQQQQQNYPPLQDGTPLNWHDWHFYMNPSK